LEELAVLCKRGGGGGEGDRPIIRGGLTNSRERWGIMPAKTRFGGGAGVLNGKSTA